MKKVPVAWNSVREHALGDFFSLLSDHDDPRVVAQLMSSGIGSILEAETTVFAFRGSFAPNGICDIWSRGASCPAPIRFDPEETTNELLRKVLEYFSGDVVTLLMFGTGTTISGFILIVPGTETRTFMRDIKLLSMIRKKTSCILSVIEKRRAEMEEGT